MGPLHFMTFPRPCTYLCTHDEADQITDDTYRQGQPNLPLPEVMGELVDQGTDDGLHHSELGTYTQGDQSREENRRSPS